MTREGWLTADRAQDWRDLSRTAARRGDVAQEIADDATAITIRRGTVTLSSQTVRLLTPSSAGREAAGPGGEQAEADLIVLGTSTLDVQRGDRFAVGAQWYEVVYVAPEQPSSGERREAYARQMQ